MEITVKSVEADPALNQTQPSPSAAATASSAGCGSRSVDQDTAAISAADLWEQQLWCWGQDIKHRPLNLLVQYGFERQPAPAGSDASSVYCMPLSPSSRWLLRGFGVFYGDDRHGGLFLRRGGFEPQLTERAVLKKTPWLVQDLPRLVCPQRRHAERCRALLHGLLQEVVRYETWIVERLGAAHREATLHARPSKQQQPGVSAEGMLPAWKRLCDSSAPRQNIPVGHAPWPRLLHDSICFLT